MCYGKLSGIATVPVYVQYLSAYEDCPGFYGNSMRINYIAAEQIVTHIDITSW